MSLVRALPALLALAASACWSKGVIPKSPPTGTTLAKKGGACTVDDECADDLVCDQNACIPWHRMAGPVPEIPADELAAQIESGAVQVLDVRTRMEFAMGHARGARHVPIGRLDDELDQLPLDKNSPVVAVCLTAHRSIAAVRLLQRHGYDVVQLERGWRSVGKVDGFPKEKGRQKRPK